MPFKQFTQCVEAKNHRTMNQYVQSILTALLGSALMAVIPLAMGEPWCLLFLPFIFLAMGLVAHCRWWLYDRLICLCPPDLPCPDATDQVVIGMLVDIDPPGNKAFFDRFDTDYSIGILPAPNKPGAVNPTPPVPVIPDQPTLEASVPYGFLVKEQPAVQAIGVPFTGHFATETHNGRQSAVLHCEFEGAGIYDMGQAAAIALFLAVAALVTCMLLPGLAGVVLAALLALLAFLAVFFGAIVGLGDQGSPADVNPGLGEFHQNDHKGVGADLLVVMGSWIYDSGHNDSGGGWNEIHPIKLCECIGTWTGEWPPDINDLEIRWATAVGGATSTGTLERQKQPENQWQVHPVIDGCQPFGVIV